MAWAQSVVSLIIGLVALAVGFTSKSFYPSSWGLGDRARTIPRWFGGLRFVVGGLAFIYSGIQMSPYRIHWFPFGRRGNPFLGLLSAIAGGNAIYRACQGIWKPHSDELQPKRPISEWRRHVILLVVGLAFLYGAWVSFRA
jgi:hypothetical protein